MAVEFEDNRMQVKEAIRDAAIGFLHEAAGEMVTYGITVCIIVGTFYLRFENSVIP